MKRRTLLTGTVALALAQGLVGCAGTQADALRVQVLRNSIPPSVLRQFQKRLNGSVDVQFREVKQLASLFNQLYVWANPGARPGAPLGLPFLNRQPVPATPADLLTLGDYWLEPAIRQNLIQPIQIEKLSAWEQLSPVWQSLVRRDRNGFPDLNGEVWAAPYRWHTLMLVYHKRPFTALGWTPTEWTDLWKPEVAGHLSLPSHPRLVIGLALKSLGQSWNTASPETVPDLPERLTALHRQVKVYSSETYLESLINEDTWMAVGWSLDILPVLQRFHQLAAVIPAQGTALSADLWVRPRSPDASPAAAEEPAANHALINSWMDFCWQPDVAVQLSTAAEGLSPLLNSPSSQSLPAALRSVPFITERLAVFDQSEFLGPLPDPAIQAYFQLWERLLE